VTVLADDSSLNTPFIISRTRWSITGVTFAEPAGAAAFPGVGRGLAAAGLEREAGPPVLAASPHACEQM